MVLLLNVNLKQGWETPELIEDTFLNQVTLILQMKQGKAAKKSGEKNFRKSNINFGQYAA